jgi:NAD(P)-dependent dehydrogenase (short-subunit alcohol dehydrogenase family)
VAFRPFDLTGKVALVTGGNGGIGFGMAEGLAQAGADVIIWGTNEEKNRAAAARLQTHGRRVLAQRVDVADEQAVIQGMQDALQAMGRLDTAIANAGIVGDIKPSIDYSQADFQKVMRINVDGVFFTLREACRHMIARAKAGEPGGSLIGISSIGAMDGAARTPAYGSSKGAVLSMIRSFAVEHARFGIRANCVHPGWVLTDINRREMQDPKYQGLVNRIPARRFGLPADLAGIAIYLASDASSFHTGDRIVLDGGYTVF